MAEKEPTTPSPIQAADRQGNPAEEPFQETGGDPPQTQKTAASQRSDPIGPDVPDDPLAPAKKAWARQRQMAEGLQGEEGNPGSQQPVEQGEQGDPSHSNQPESDAGTAPPDPMEVLEEAGFDTQNLPDHLDEEGAYNFGRYWQSKHDKTQERVEELQSQLEEVETLAPVVQQIQQDPELASVVAEHLQQRQGGQPVQASPQTAQQDVQPQQGPLEMPTPPEKPKDFDRYEAVTDPDSESAEFLEKQEQYMEELAEYNQHLVTQQQQREQQLQQQQQMQAAQQQLVQQAMFEHGLDQKQAQEFVQWAQSDESLNDMDAWVEAFKAANGIEPQPPTQQPPHPATNGQAQNGHSPQLTPAQRARQQRQQPMRGGQQFQNSATSQRGTQVGPTGDDALFAVRQSHNPVFGTGS